MDYLDFCAKNPQLCKILKILESKADFICMRYPELCYPSVVMDICKICPVCCYGNIRINTLEKLRDEILSKVDELIKAGVYVDEILRPSQFIDKDEAVIFVPIVIKRPKTLSDLETVVKSGGIITDKKLTEAIKKVII